MILTGSQDLAASLEKDSIRSVALPGESAYEGSRFYWKKRN